jgi:hypothetical protein
MEKLNCKDLMVGDWVLLFDDKIAKVDCIGNTEVFLSDETGLDWQVTYEHIRPIFLTPEILELNGFVLQENEVGLYGVTIAPHYTRDDLPFEVFCDGEPFAIWFSDPIDIAYVHQLQHVIRLCGVNQEIVL